MPARVLSRRGFLGQSAVASSMGLGSVLVPAQGSLGHQPSSTSQSQDDDGVIAYPGIHIADMMKGFPPARDRRVTLGNWAETTAHVRWTQQHSEFVFRTLSIERGSGPVWRLPRKMIRQDDFEQAQVRWGPSIKDAERISVFEWLDRTETDALVCLHDGHIAAECYFGDMSTRTRHHLMCGAKSILATVLAPYLANGLLHADDPVTKHVPELADTGFRGTTIRHLLDLQFILERLTGRSYVEHLSDVWQRLRPEGAMTVSVDNIGTPYGFAGLSCTARDWARWGEMVRNSGHVDGQLALPGVGALIAEVRQDPGYRTATSLSSELPGTGYRNQFWTSLAERGAEPLFYASGLYFQKCLIDLPRKNVIVWMGSFWDRDADKIAKGYTFAHGDVGFWSFVTEALPSLVS